MIHTITTKIEGKTPDEWKAMGAALAYIGQYADVLAEDPETAVENFMGAFNAGGFPAANPGAVTIRSVDADTDAALYDCPDDEEMILMIEWPDGYAYPVFKKTFEGAVAYEVREA